MINRRKICVVTVARSDYGLMRTLIREIYDDNDLELQLLVTGMHLSHEYGHTVDRIIEDGFPITEQVEVSLSSNSHVGMVKATGLAMISLADAFKRLMPDMIVILGDRFEMFAAASAANLMNIPIAHIHGGELTYGAVDDSLRHSITKLAHLHFPVAEVYKQRIIQMGELPQRVYNFGAPGLDFLADFQLLTKSELEDHLKINIAKKLFVVTLHAVTRDNQQSAEIVATLLRSLDPHKDATIIFTESNIDAGGQVINTIIRDHVKNYPGLRYSYKELGLPNYLSLVKIADVVIGNSSSGVIEVPCVNTPSINIGSRQDGRLRLESVIDAEFDERQIKMAIERALSAEFQQKIPSVTVPFYKKQASRNIKQILKTVSLDNLRKKEFFDMELSYESV